MSKQQPMNRQMPTPENREVQDAVKSETPEEAQARKDAYRKANGMEKKTGSGFGAGTEDLGDGEG